MRSILLAVAAYTGVALAQQAPLITAQTPGRVVAPGSALSLSVEVRTRAGAVLANQAVLFVAPETAPNGVFPQSTPPNGRTVRVSTGANGIANANFAVGDTRGFFLVNAQLEGTLAAATFAITVSAQPPSAPFSADAARAAVKAQILRNATEDERLRLHGPFLLPARTQIAPAVLTPNVDRAHPNFTIRPSWFFWIDDLANAEFSHPARYVILDAAASNAATAISGARIIPARWWPVATQPGAPGVSLAPPVEAGPSVASLRAILGPGRPFADAPADACAILFYGTGMTGSYAEQEKFRDYLVNNNHVPAGNVIQNGRSATAEDVQKLIDRAREKNCKKIYLIISTHGADRGSGGGGLSLREGEGGEALLQYEDFVQMLKPLAGAELCVVVRACYSGLLPLWLTGHGFTGTVITSADTQHSSFMSPNGGRVLNQLFTALDNVPFNQALQYVLANSTDELLKEPMPVSLAVTATGTRQAVADFLYVSGAGDSRTLIVKRPKSANLLSPFTVTLRVQSPSIADFGNQSITVVIPPGAPSFPVTVFGRDDGETPYTFQGSDGLTGQAYVGTAVIQVGSFKVTPKTLTMAPGDTRTVTATRYGLFVSDKDPGKYKVTSRDPNIATVNQADIEVPVGQNTFNIVVTGRSAGTTSIDIEDKEWGMVRTVQVTVTSPTPPASACPTERIFNANFNLFANIGMHPFGISSAIMTWRRTGTTFTLSGNNPLLVNASGTVNLPACTFSGQGISTVPLAGFSGASGLYSDGSISGANFDTIRFRYTLGGNGVFPGGQPTIWDVTGLAGSPTPCTYSVTPLLLNFPGSEGEDVVNVGTTNVCTWYVRNLVSWVEVFASTNIGSGTVRFKIADNPDPRPRSTTVTIADKTVTINQAAPVAGLPLISKVLSGSTFDPGINSGSWVTIQGQNLSQTTRIWAGADFIGGRLPTMLDGVSVRINGMSAYPYYISPTQLNVLSPDDGQLGDVQVKVTTRVGASGSVTTPKLSLAPGLFMFDPQDRRYVAGVHADGTFLGKPGLFPGLTTRSAKAFDPLQLFGSGCPDTMPATPSGMIVNQAAPLASPVAAWIGDKDAQVLFAGKVGSGLIQFNVITPDLPAGDHLVKIFCGPGAGTQDFAYLTVE